MKIKICIKKSSGFSIIEILFAITIFSFGLTALMKTQQIANATIKSYQKKFCALLLAQQCLESAISSKSKVLTDYEIYQNKTLYKISFENQFVMNNTYELTVIVQWKNKKFSISKRINSIVKQ